MQNLQGTAVVSWSNLAFRERTKVLFCYRTTTIKVFDCLEKCECTVCLGERESD